jgi:redox-sensitive bicupin YhaK (pirin superfamily)
VLEPHPSRVTQLGSLTIWRALPVRQRRLIGPWCFLDRYGPVSFTSEKPMDVAAHPHIGIQTVSWLVEGEVIHHDSLGFEAVVRPGGVNVMTSGSGIAHAEETPAPNSGRLNGVQLWVALPDGHRHIAPSFESIVEVPRAELRGGFGKVFAGALERQSSPAAHYSELLGAEVTVHRGESLQLPLDPRFEHGVFVLDGDPVIQGQPLAINTLYYLGTGRGEISVRSGEGARLLLIGGPPFPEKVLMWWNFVARTPDEIATARADWQEHRRFGDVIGYSGPRLDAPSLKRLAPPNPAS